MNLKIFINPFIKACRRISPLRNVRIPLSQFSQEMSSKEITEELFKLSSKIDENKINEDYSELVENYL